MTWQEIQKHLPHQWLLIEAIKAHSAGGKRILDDLNVINTYPNSRIALKSYAQFQKEAPNREYVVLHTSRQTLDIKERRWLGIRGIQ